MLRMARDIANAAKHGDLTWNSEDTETHGAVLAKLEYLVDDNGAGSHRIMALDIDGARHDVVDVLRDAIGEWRGFVRVKGI